MTVHRRIPAPGAMGGRMEAQLRRVRLRLATVVVIIFVFVSSGAFGLEDMVGWSGPGIALVLFVLGWNLVGDALRDIMDPRMRGSGQGE